MILALDHIYKSYAANLILEDISLKIEDNDRIGLIGANGAGKSTLLKVIVGLQSCDEGTVSRNRSAQIGFLQQDSGLQGVSTIHEEMRRVFQTTIDLETQMHAAQQALAQCEPSGGEYERLAKEYDALHTAFEAADGYQVEVKIKTVLNGMGFADKPLDTVIDTLSGGEKTRLALAKLLLQAPDLLILDEPTNHLDFRTLTWLEDYLSEYRGALLIVSHDRYFLDKLVTSVCDLERHHLIRYKGNYTKYLQLKQERIARQQKEYEIQSQQIASMEEYVQKNIVRASTSKSAKSRIAALERMERIEKPPGELKRAHIAFEFERDPVKDVLTVQDLDLRVGEGSREKCLFEHLDFKLYRGEKVAVIGANGVGKSTFLKVVQGLLPHTCGMVEWGKNVKIAYFDQEGRQLNPQNTVLEELWSRFPTEYEQKIRSRLGAVLLTGENVFKQVGVISGGERAKLNFAILMAQHGNVLVLDEPTNHLDLDTKEVLDEALCSFPGTILLVSHDRYLLNKLPSRIVEFLPENTVKEYAGNYDAYLERRAYEAAQQSQGSVMAPAPKQAGAKNSGGYRSRREKNEENKRRQRLKELEETLTGLEQEISQLQDSLSDPAVMGDYVKMQQVCVDLEERKAQYSRTEDEWLQLAETLG